MRTICDNGHCVIVDSESLQGFRARVNESKTMYFSAGEIERRDARILGTIDAHSLWGTIEDHFTVDQVVVGDGYTTGHRVI